MHRTRQPASLVLVLVWALCGESARQSALSILSPARRLTNCREARQNAAMPDCPCQHQLVQLQLVGLAVVVRHIRIWLASGQTANISIRTRLSRPFHMAGKLAYFASPISYRCKDQVVLVHHTEQAIEQGISWVHYLSVIKRPRHAFLFPVITLVQPRGYRIVLGACRAGLGKW
ncbi:hypothetical protein J3F84DRAFT_81470 [Trichoderma pleuroticola]